MNCQTMQNKNNHLLPAIEIQYIEQSKPIQKHSPKTLVHKVLHTFLRFYDPAFNRFMLLK